MLLPAALMAATYSTPLLTVDEESATVRLDQAREGLSGVIVRHFDKEHSAIIANASVRSYDAATQSAQLALSDYNGLVQNTLPSGSWHPRPGDEARIAPDYSRALLIAPDVLVYERITAAFPSLSWIHPDRFAAYLSGTGHPSPTAEDFSGFCTDNAVGLLYIYLESSLFTLDCKSLTLFERSHAPIVYEATALPFFSRVENIREGLWGEGSGVMKQYAPHYLELMETANPENATLAAYENDPSRDAYKRNAKEAADDGSWFSGITNLFGSVEVGLEHDDSKE